MFNCAFVLIATSVPTQFVGSAMTIITTIGITASIGVPMIVLLRQPLPFFVMIGLMGAVLMLSVSSAIKDEVKTAGVSEGDINEIEEAWKNTFMSKRMGADSSFNFYNLDTSLEMNNKSVDMQGINYRTHR